MLLSVLRGSQLKTLYHIMMNPNIPWNKHRSKPYRLSHGWYNSFFACDYSFECLETLRNWGNPSCSNITTKLISLYGEVNGFPNESDRTSIDRVHHGRAPTHIQWLYFKETKRLQCIPARAGTSRSVSLQVDKKPHRKHFSHNSHDLWDLRLHKKG